MIQISTLAASDRSEWLTLWQGYLAFYESEVSDQQTALTFERLVDSGYPIHGAIARDVGGSAIGLVHWLTHPATWSEGEYCTSRTSSSRPTPADRGREERSSAR